MKFKLSGLLLFLGIVFSVFIVYVSTVARYPVGFGDSDELITTGYLLGVPHPPGYPLFNVLVWVFTHLPLPVSVAFKANVLAAFLHALTVGVVYLAAKEMLKLFIEKLEVERWMQEIIIIVSSLSLGFSFLFWTYANVVEVFSLHDLLVALLLYLGLRIYSTRLSKHTFMWNNRYWWIFCMVFGLSLAHHQTIVFLIPGLVLLVLPLSKSGLFTINTLKNIVLGGFITALVLCASYTLLLWYASNNAMLSWTFSSNLEGVVRMILRQDYAGILTGEGVATGVYFTGFYLPENIQALIHYLTVSIPSHLGFPLYILSVMGMVLMLKKAKGKLRIALGLLVILPGVFIAFYLTLPDPQSAPSYRYLIAGFTDRMYLMGYVVMSIFVPVSLIKLQKKFFQTFPKISPKILYGIVLLPLYVLVTNYEAVNLNNYNASYTYAREMLASAEPGSLIVCFSDISCFSLAYSQGVEHYRTDVAVIPVTTQLQNKAIRTKFSSLFMLESPVNPQHIAAFIAWNLEQKKPVYVAEINSYYIDELGMDGEVFYLEPHGYLNKVVCGNDNVTFGSLQKYELSINLSQYIPDKRHQLAWAFRSLLMEHHARNGTIFARRNWKAEALNEFDLAAELVPDDGKIKELREGLPKYQGDPRYLKPTACKTADDLLKLLKTCSILDRECIYKTVFKATLAEPQNTKVRIQLARLYQESGLWQMAEAEYRNILRLEPDNTLAKTSLHNIKDFPWVD